MYSQLEALRTYIYSFMQCNFSKAQYFTQIPAINDPNDEEDEKKQYAQSILQQPKYRGPKKQVSLVFVGETGVGKTTLLTSLNDFINHIPFEEV